MHNSPAGKLVRKALQMGFVLLFGAMSIFHFPVMAFGGGDPHAGYSHSMHARTMHAQALADISHHDGHAGDATPSKPSPCDGFGCFLAVEPPAIESRPVHAILFAVLRFAPANFLLPVTARPDLPPPRLQG